MRLAIRVDDIGWTTEAIPGEPPLKVPDKGLRLAREFHKALGGLPWLAAVIPACLDAEGLSWLQSRPKGLTVALHGYDHRKRASVCNEYHGLDTHGCRRLIRAGLDLLPGLQVRHFVAPWNAAPPGLAPALVAEGIRYFWTGPTSATVPENPRRDLRGLLLVPSWMPFYGASRPSSGTGGIPGLADMAPLLPMARNAVLTLHLPWEYAVSPDLSGLRALAKTIRGHVVGADEFVGQF